MWGAPLKALSGYLPPLTTQDFVLGQLTAAVPTGSDIRKIENYLNSVTTLEARFVQNASNGNVAEGQLWIEKPNKIRMEYENFIAGASKVLAFSDLEDPQ